MSACKYSHVPVGADCTLESSQASCPECKHRFSILDPHAVYQGHASEVGIVVDIFSLSKAIVCEGCGNEMNAFSDPCYTDYFVAKEECVTLEIST